MTARMSILLRKEQGFYFMQRISSKMQILEGFNVHFRVTCDNRNVDFT